MNSTKYLHFISFTCDYHESTWYTLYTTGKPKFDKKMALASLKHGKHQGKSNGKERHPQIVHLAKKYNIKDVFSIKRYEVNDSNLQDLIKDLNSKYGQERETFIKYSRS